MGLTPPQFLSAEELGGLHSEQLALVDFLVLTAGRRFVGFEVTCLRMRHIRNRRIARFRDGQKKICLIPEPHRHIERRHLAVASCRISPTRRQRLFACRRARSHYSSASGASCTGARDRAARWWRRSCPTTRVRRVCPYSKDCHQHHASGGREADAGCVLGASSRLLYTLAALRRCVVT